MSVRAYESIESNKSPRLFTVCRNSDALHAWVKMHLNLDVPREPVCHGHDAPFEYLKHVYFEPAKDVVVWAPRGGGKTRLGAVATLLDLLHKPGVSVRILGGSVEQSLKMWEHLVPDVEAWAADQIVGRARARMLALRNRSRAAVLTQSQRAVRGLRVQKLRCDEVELFDPKVWEAAQLVTRSMKVRSDVSEEKRKGASGVSDRLPPLRLEEFRRVGTAHRSSDITPKEVGSAHPTEIAGTVEAISTLHSPFGLMNEVIEQARVSGTKVLHWCLLEVLERCPITRDCVTCPLWDDCKGVAKKKCNGFVKIEDAIAMKQRVSEEVWQAEMLCQRPSVRGCVFPAFDEATHVCVDISGQLSMVSCGNTGGSRLGLHNGQRTTDNGQTANSLSLAIDFGFANPFVCLWVRHYRGQSADGNDVTHVIDEYVQSQRTVDEHLRAIAKRPWGRAATVSCDPAGSARNEHTGHSSVDALRHAGYRVKYRSSRIVDGLELIRAALKPASGPARLFIHPRCKQLIKAMRCYHYSQDSGELPVKDGEHDHLVDALRYHMVNFKRSKTTWGWY